MGILSGMSKAQRQQLANDRERKAKQQDQEARQYRETAAAIRKKYGHGSPTEETNAQICEANARDLRNSAKTLRKWRS